MSIAKRVLAILFFLAVLKGIAPVPALAQPQTVAENHDIVRVGQNYTVEVWKTINGNITVISGNLDVEGTVNGDATCINGTLTLGPDAHVSGDATSLFGKLEKFASAKVGGSEVYLRMRPLHLLMWAFPLTGFFAAAGILLGLLASLGYVLLLLLIFLLFPKPIQSLADEIEANPWQILGWGVLSWVAVLPIAAILAISCVGILLIPFEIALLIIGLLAGYTAASFLLGRRIGHWAPAIEQHPLVGMLVGALILEVVRYVPFFGWIVMTAAYTFGLGAFVLALWRSWKERRGAAGQSAA